MEAFVYRWRNSLTREWYIGYHKGTESDGYICSSRTARPRIETEAGWSRRILRWGTKKDMLALEHRILKRLRAATNPRSLNRSHGYPVAPTNSGRKKGSSRLGYDLNQMTSKEVAEHYRAELARGDLERIFYVDQWLIKRLVK